MSKVEEMSEKYADKRLLIVEPSIYDSGYSRTTKMSLRLFDGYEVESAYEYGANAVLEEIEKLVNTGNWLAFPRQNITELRNKIKELKGI